MRFTGKIALITGAARGVGRAVAVKFAKGGAKVYLQILMPPPLPKPKLN